MRKSKAQRILFLGLTLSVCAISLGIVQVYAATDVPATPKTEEERQRLNLDNRDIVREARREKLEEGLQNRIINLSTNVVNRLTSALDRMDNIANRLGTRIANLKSQGVATEKAEASLADAKKYITTAHTSLSTMPPISEIVRGDTPRESFGAVRGRFMEVRDLIRQAHMALSTSVAQLKEAVQASRPNAGVSDAVKASESITPTNQ